MCFYNFVPQSIIAPGLKKIKDFFLDWFMVSHEKFFSFPLWPVVALFCNNNMHCSGSSVCKRDQAISHRIQQMHVCFVVASSLFRGG